MLQKLSQLIKGMNKTTGNGNGLSDEIGKYIKIRKKDKH